MEQNSDKKIKLVHQFDEINIDELKTSVNKAPFSRGGKHYIAHNFYVASSWVDDKEYPKKKWVNKVEKVMMTIFVLSIGIIILFGIFSS